MGEPLNVSMSDAKSPDDQKAHEEAMVKVATEGAAHIRSTVNAPGGEKVTTIITQQEIDAAQESGQRPEGIPEKFWDAEAGKVNVAAMLKAQQDAETALRQGHKEKPPVEPQVDEQATAEAQDNVVATASAEWQEKGELTDATFESLAKVGLSRDMVNEYIAGQQAIVAVVQQSAYGVFDGQPEKYEEAAQWAATNLSDDEIAAIDVQVQSMNPAIVRAGAEALAKAYAEGRDIEPETTLQSGGNTSGTTGGYKSGAEMRADMSNPRYKTDPAFRAEVSAKIAKSTANLFG